MNRFVLRASLIDAFWDAIVRGEPHPDATGISPEQVETVQWFQRLSAPLPDPNRDRAWAALQQRTDDHHIMESITMSQSIALAPPVPRRPRTSPHPGHGSVRSRTMTAISLAVLLALLGALAFGILADRGRDSRQLTIPAVVASPSPESTAPLGSDWGQFRGGVERTGYTSDPGPGSDLNLRWSFSADESLNGIMEADGKVFAYGAEGGLYAIDAGSGQQIWAIDLIESQFGDVGRVPLPAVADDVVYASTPSGALVAVDAEGGSVLWQKPLSDGMLSAPTVSDSPIYVAVDVTHMLSLAASSGNEEWSWEVPGGISSQYPTIAD